MTDTNGKITWMYGHVAYEIAYRTIYDALPDCQACICM